MSRFKIWIATLLVVSGIVFASRFWWLPPGRTFLAGGGPTRLEHPALDRATAIWVKSVLPKCRGAWPCAPTNLAVWEKLDLGPEGMPMREFIHQMFRKTFGVDESGIGARHPVAQSLQAAGHGVPQQRLPNMVRVVARHADGTVFYDKTMHNLRTNAGVTWQEGQMAGTTAAVCTYIAVSSTAITPSVSDTALSGEITTSGLARTNGTVSYSSTASDLGSGTYTSGGTISGSAGQTCALSSFNNGCSGSTATVALTGSNTIASGTALTVTAAGTSCTSAPTSATLGNGTATCSGTATVSTALGIIPTYTVSNTFTASAAVSSVQSTALFNASSSGTECFENTFSAVSLNSGDTLTVKWTINY